MSAKIQNEYQKLWPQREISEALGRLSLPFIAIVFYCVIQLILNGSASNHYLFMLIFAVLSFVASFGYAVNGYINGAAGRRNIGAMLLALGAFIPYLYGCYIFGYQGLYGFVELSSPNANTVWTLIKSIAAIILGYSIVKGLHTVTEIDNQYAAKIRNLS